MSSAAFVYSGRDNLVAMRCAVRYNAHLLRLVERFAPAAGPWMDFGAGDGQIAVPLHMSGKSVVAIEADPELAARNTAAGVPTHHDLDAVPDASMAYVYSLNVLEHIEDDQAMLRALARKLRPGGRLFLYVPAFQMLFSSMDRLVGHHRRYGLKHLVGLTERAGFRPIAARYVDSLGFVASVAYKLLPDQGGTVEPATVARYDRWVLPASLALDAVAGWAVGKNVYVAAELPS